MQLQSNTTPVKQSVTTLAGHQVITIPAGKVLRIETTPGGVEILDVTIPAGKSWTATIRLDIVETDT